MSEPERPAKSGARRRRASCRARERARPERPGRGQERAPAPSTSPTAARTSYRRHQIEGGNWNNDWWAWEHDPSSGCWNRAAAPATPSTATARTSTWSRSWVRHLPLLGGVEPHRARGRRVLPAAIDHYRQDVRRLPARGHRPDRHVPPTTPAGGGPAGGRPGQPPIASPTSERAPANWATHDRGCTINEPNIVATMGWPHGDVPARCRPSSAVRAINDVFVDAHRKAVEAIRGAGVPVGLTSR